MLNKKIYQMKTLKILSLSLLVLMWSCTNPDKAEAEQTLQDFENYIQELDSSTVDLNIENWTAIETKYQAFDQQLDSTKQHLDMSSQEHLEELQVEFATIEKKYKAAIDNTQTEANEKMVKIENWMAAQSESYKDSKDIPVGTIEMEWKDFQEDFKAKWNTLTKDTKEKWNTLENRVNQWIEYELKPNLK